MLCMGAGRCLLIQAAKQFQQPQLPAKYGGGIGISLVIDELLVAKRNANRRERYVTSLNHYLRQFSKGQEQRAISDFTYSDVEKWMAKYPSAVTRRTWLSRLSPLFAFAVRRRYIAANPCDQIERVTVDRKPPLILTPAQSRELLAACPTVMKPYLILGMFAGIRPEEIARLDWSQINLAEGTVLVDGKTRRQRLVKLEPRMVAALVKHPLKTGPVTPSNSTVDRWRVTSRRLLGLAKWPQDLLRHTAASYLLALKKDAAAVALTLGNSVKILMSTYVVPVSQSDSDVFWDVCPTMSYKVGLVGATARSQPSGDGQVNGQNLPACDARPQTGNGETGSQGTAQRELAGDEGFQTASGPQKFDRQPAA